MTQDERTIETLKGILKAIEFIEYEDPEDGLVIFCPTCGGIPEPGQLSPGKKNAMTPYRARNGKGHDKSCELARALYGDL